MIPLKDLFDAMTVQLKYYSKIRLTKSGGVVPVKVNGNLSHGFDTGCKNKNTKQVERIFHEGVPGEYVYRECSVSVHC